MRIFPRARRVSGRVYLEQKLVDAQQFGARAYLMADPRHCRTARRGFTVVVVKHDVAQVKGNYSSVQQPARIVFKLSIASICNSLRISARALQDAVDRLEMLFTYTAGLAVLTQ